MACQNCGFFEVALDREDNAWKFYGTEKVVKYCSECGVKLMLGDKVDIDALNEEFMAEWRKRCEIDEVLKFLRKEFTETYQPAKSSVSAYAKITIQLLIADRESEIKQQVLKELEEK